MPIGLYLSAEVKFVVRNLLAFRTECGPVISTAFRSSRLGSSALAKTWLYLQKCVPT
jgi:hypothetical protein